MEAYRQGSLGLYIVRELTWRNGGEFWINTSGGGTEIGGVVFSAEKIVLKKPPKSLDKYYPPASKKFEYLSNMHAMSTAFTGIRLNVNDENWEKALHWANGMEELLQD